MEAASWKLGLMDLDWIAMMVFGQAMISGCKGPSISIDDKNSRITEPSSFVKFGRIS